MEEVSNETCNNIYERNIDLVRGITELLHNLFVTVKEVRVVVERGPFHTELQEVSPSED